MSLLVVPLARERLYKKPGLPVKNYPRSASLGLMSEHDRRVADDEKTVGFPVHLPPCLHHGEKTPSLDLLEDHWRGLLHKPVCKILLAQWPVLSPTVSDLNAPPPSGVTAVDLQHETDWRKIVKLDSLERQVRCMLAGNGAHSARLPRMQATWSRWFRAPRLWGIRYQYCR